MEVVFAGHKKEVLSEIHNGAIKGFVGDAKVHWGLNKKGELFELPFLRIPIREFYTEINQKELRKLVVPFIILHRKAMNEAMKPTMFLNFDNVPESESYAVYKKANNKIPYWMWVICKYPAKSKKKGAVSRRRNFKTDKFSELLLGKYHKPGYCKACLYMKECMTACSNPELVSSDGIKLQRRNEDERIRREAIAGRSR